MRHIHIYIYPQHRSHLQSGHGSRDQIFGMAGDEPGPKQSNRPQYGTERHDEEDHEAKRARTEDVEKVGNDSQDYGAQEHSESSQVL